MAGSLSMTARKTKEDGLDFYPTQPWATRAFVEAVAPAGLIWEPACGGGHMSEVLKETNPVFSTDIFDHGYPHLNMVQNFMDQDIQYPPETEWIVTNPPFKHKLSERFVLKGLSLGKKMAVLCRLTWLEGGRRYTSLFKDHPPSRVIVLVDRLGFTEDDCDVGRGGMLPYAWYVWENNSTTTTLEWIPPGSFKRLTRDDDAVRFNGPIAGVNSESSDHLRYSLGSEIRQLDLSGFFI